MDVYVPGGITAHVLDRGDWHRLAETGLPLDVWSKLDPRDVQVVVVEDDGVIVRCWATLACRHVEGFWCRPDHRGQAGTLRRLFVEMRTRLKALGATTVVTHAVTPDVVKLLESAGASRLPGDSYLLPVDFGPWRKE